MTARRPWPWAAVAAAAMVPWAAPALPVFPAIVALGAIATLLLLAKPTRLPGACLLAACWTLAAAERGQRDRLVPELAGEVLVVTGTVVGLPERRDEGVRFRFRPDRHGAAQPLPGQLRVSWYRDVPEVRPGERWQLRLRLQPPRTPVNFAGHDGERWLFGERIGALASVREGQRLSRSHPTVHTLRAALRDRVERRWVDRPEVAGLLNGLVVGDRSAIPRATRETLVATGTGHLLAISGLHVGLAAAGGYGLARALAPFLPRVFHAGRLAFLASLVSATAYAALAGLGVSTRRALVMLAVVALAGLARRRVPPERAFLLALLAVLALDPRAPLQAGFWLSFGAVFVLGWLFRPGGRRWGAVESLARAQLGLALVMMPLVLSWGFPVASAGLGANLVAVPIVSLLVVPIALVAAVSFAVSDALGGLLLGVAGQVLAGLMAVLGWLAEAPGLSPRTLAPPSWLAAAASVSAALVALGPLATRWRAVALLALLPLWAGRPAGGARDSALLDVLDVGQGTAVLLTHASTAFVFDTGPGHPGRWDRVDALIAPMLRHAGHERPDRVFVSHGDLDHAGGLASLVRRYPSTSVHAHLRGDGDATLPCAAGLAGREGELRFSARHPGPYLPYLGNDSSCVLSVAVPGWSVLMPGDIGAAAEARLVTEGLGRHDVVIVPHHGSRSSSTPAFVEATRPALALVTAGAGNRFGFPHADVVSRYSVAGARVVDTGACGGLRVRRGATGEFLLSSARRVRAAPWRWPPAALCP